MKSTSSEQIVGIPSSSPQPTGAVLHSHSHSLFKSKKNKLTIHLNWMSNFSKKANSCTKCIKEHVNLGSNVPATLKGKLNLGKRILQAGGIEKVFRRNFSIVKGEKLLKAFQCYLSTTAGPISGLLFISNERIAFQSDKYLVLTSPKGDAAKIPYKVIIPLKRIKRANSTEDVNGQNKKYIQIVTVDDFEFWFMGFLSYKKSLKCLQEATLESQRKNRDIVLAIPRSSIDNRPYNNTMKSTDMHALSVHANNSLQKLY